ncbi:hypothetical protein NFHSH190041_20930 [Shewanella sp. NFH-SH190041]|uniref:DUF2750 domain-containing protein n=1 Tax=Shewanella sp. NFH-SH190041 TaxID=2950245 RepID=UPI0021C3029C|nr:DUF2750 domain-containing protein [Shewanella sp. NFH-SH190041]BDM64641.1 hypothetical protein NFHSH190041_20930 [Shewanella sp. NFH-SH190041]
MSELAPALAAFIENVKAGQTVWGLQDETGEGWVVCDSAEYENTDVMPLWSTEALASAHCTDEWASYQAMPITLGEFLEYWVSDFNDDGVLVGIDWTGDEICLEMDPVMLAKELADIEEDEQ